MAVEEMWIAETRIETDDDWYPLWESIAHHRDNVEYELATRERDHAHTMLVSNSTMWMQDEFHQMMMSKSAFRDMVLREMKRLKLWRVRKVKVTL